MATEEARRRIGSGIGTGRGFRPLRGGEVFLPAVVFYYRVDTVGEHALFPFPFGIRLLQHVIKAEAEEFKLPRIPASACL